MIIDFNSEELPFAVNLLFRACKNGEVANDDLWEESVILVIAPDEDSARKKAVEMGISRETSYTNNEGVLVRWVFVQIERVFEILSPEISCGTELFSRHLRNAEVESLLTPFEG